jgi:hypothetical protein
MSAWYRVASQGLADEGPRFFTKGLGNIHPAFSLGDTYDIDVIMVMIAANLARAVPMCGCTFLVYEGIMATWPRPDTNDTTAALTSSKAKLPTSTATPMTSTTHTTTKEIATAVAAVVESQNTN